MKISEMTNDQAANAMIRLSGAFSALCEDDDMIKILDKVQKLNGEKAITMIGKIIPEFVVFGLKKHKEDFYEIIGALTEQPTSKIGAMNFVQTVNELRNSYDEVVKDFFTLPAKAGKTQEKESV